MKRSKIFLKILISIIFFLTQTTIYSQSIKEIHYENIEIEEESIIYTGYEADENIKGKNLEIEFISKKYSNKSTIFKFRVNNYGTYKLFFIEQDLAKGTSKSIEKILEYREPNKINNKIENIENSEVFKPSSEKNNLTNRTTEKSLYDTILEESDFSKLPKGYPVKEYFNIAQKLEKSENFNIILKSIELYKFIFTNFTYSEFSDKSKQRYLELKNRYIDMK